MTGHGFCVKVPSPYASCLAASSFADAFRAKSERHACMQAKDDGVGDQRGHDQRAQTARSPSVHVKRESFLPAVTVVRGRLPSLLRRQSPAEHLLQSLHEFAAAQRPSRVRVAPDGLRFRLAAAAQKLSPGLPAPPGIMNIVARSRGNSQETCGLSPGSPGTPLFHRMAGEEGAFLPNARLSDFNGYTMVLRPRRESLPDCVFRAMPISVPN